jgi:exoribonuclease R
VAPDGGVRLDGAERALIRSRAKLAYDRVRDDDLPAGFAALADRIKGAEQRRGAARVNPPVQEIAALGEGRFELLFRPQPLAEERNAALSLAGNLAVAELLRAGGTGLFRVMAEPDEDAVQRLRHTATALGLPWPAGSSLAELERTLRPADPKHATFMLAVQRASGGASYAPFRDGVRPWHAAVAATYAHATAPLRRLADRYVIRAALALAGGRPVPPGVTEAFERLPAVMARADGLARQLERAAIDLAEAVMLHGQAGRTFEAIATDIDDRGARIQLCDLPVVARVAAGGAKAGDRLQVRLVAADPDKRIVIFEPFRPGEGRERPQQCR